MNPNFVAGKLALLIIIGILPMIAMFLFVFTLGFAKVPQMEQQMSMKVGEKADFDSYRFILEQQNKIKKRS